MDAVPEPKPEPAPEPAPVRKARPKRTGAAPQDSLDRVPKAVPGERFEYSGLFTGKREERIPIDWPEPGAVAVVEAIGMAEDHLTGYPMTRDERHNRFLWASSHSRAPVRARALLTRGMTHVELRAGDGVTEWFVRLLGPSELDELDALAGDRAARAV